MITDRAYSLFSETVGEQAFPFTILRHYHVPRIVDAIFPIDVARIEAWS
jgi:hypothetical protein